MTYSPIDFKYLEARTDRESLCDFIGKNAGPEPVSQLDLVRHLAPSILIADGYDFNELRELYAPKGLCCEHVSSDWSGDYRDDSLRCIAIRPFKPGGYDSHPYEFIQSLAGHLRDLLVRAETTPDFGNIIRHAYIEPESMGRWKVAAEHWRKSRANEMPRTTSKPMAEQRQAERWKACVNAGLDMPSDTYGHYPRGISKVAKSFGIERQSLKEDLDKYREREFGN